MLCHYPNPMQMFEVTEMTDDTVTITNSSGIRGEIMVDIRTNRTSSGSNQDSHSTTSSGTGMIYSAVNVFQLNLTFVEGKPLINRHTQVCA